MVADSKAVGNLRALIKRYLDEIGLTVLRDPDDDFVIPAGPVMILIVPRDWGDDETIVMISANVSEGCRIEADLYEYLNERNAVMLFGKLVAYEQKQLVRFEHPLLGDFLNRAELEAAVKVVGAMALQHKPEVITRWGGM